MIYKSEKWWAIVDTETGVPFEAYASEKVAKEIFAEKKEAGVEGIEVCLVEIVIDW